jgi:hypothetical protein
MEQADRESNHHGFDCRNGMSGLVQSAFVE